MGLDLHQQPRPSPRPAVSPEMQRSLELLQLSKPELIKEIEQELQENPALEIIYEPAPEDAIGAPGDTQNDGNTFDESSWEPDADGEDHETTESDEPAAQKNTSAGLLRPPPESLARFLLKQLRLTRLTPKEIRIGTVIADSLDEDGFLKRPVEEIAASCGCSGHPEKVEKVLAVMQSFDPPGVCARDLKECLLIQARLREYESPVLTGIIMNHMDDLKRKDFKTIAKALKTIPEEVAQAARKIVLLEPRPGRVGGGQTTAGIDPDLVVHFHENRFVVSPNDDGLPKLNINPLFRDCEKNGNRYSEEDKDFMRRKKRSAEFLVGCIYQRQRTLCRVMDSILKFQRKFFEQGTSALKPLPMRTVAEDIDLSEPTVARATRNKYVQTPAGIFSLRYFFSEGIEQAQGQAVSSSVVQGLIQRIISEENPQTPLSDAKIEKKLKAAGFDIQRRTIAKFREKMGILSASLRKKL